MGVAEPALPTQGERDPGAAVQPGRAEAAPEHQHHQRPHDPLERRGRPRGPAERHRAPQPAALLRPPGTGGDTPGPVSHRGQVGLARVFLTLLPSPERGLHLWGHGAVRAGKPLQEEPKGESSPPAAPQPFLGGSAGGVRLSCPLPPLCTGRADHHLRSHRDHAGHAGDRGVAGSVHVSGRGQDRGGDGPVGTGRCRSRCPGRQSTQEDLQPVLAKLLVDYSIQSSLSM